ncbi:MAG TPA: cation-transporting P-type ATPase, partial [Chloroflexota bacterium]|nr:cation-transporting P-type ATPase [Chloroflexota bacterium]
PSHPLEAGPLIQSAARAVETGIGLGVLGAGQFTGRHVSPGVRGNAARVNAAIGIAQGFPFVRYGLRRLLGRNVADLILHVPGILSLTLSGNVLGLLVVGSESLRLLTEVISRRHAWQRYEERIEGVASALPGAIIRIESGERTPHGADVVEGTGTGVGRHGLPIAVVPGAYLPAGTRLYGGPFVLQLQAPRPFAPAERPAPPAPTVFERYASVVSRLSLAYSTVTSLLFRSFAPTVAGMLLVSPRTAMVGLDSADIGASARVLRAGVIVVGTRANRVIRRPDVLFIDHPRPLTDGFEITTATTAGGTDATELLDVAAGVAAAAGSPWGGALAWPGAKPAANGSFDGHVARAEIDGAQYSLGPCDLDLVPAALQHQHRSERILALKRGGEPAGFLVLRPRLAAAAQDLVEEARRHRTEIFMVCDEETPSIQSLAERTGISVISRIGPVAAIQSQQATGAVVAYLSDSSDAAEAFEACDLAIGLSSGRSSRFPARADLLAPDLAGVAAILEAGRRRDLAVRDSVLLSAVGNVAGAVWGIRGRPGLARASQVVYLTSLAALAAGWVRLRGGERPVASITRLVDPRPERWGRRNVADVLRALRTTRDGLTSAQALERRHAERPPAARSGMAQAILQQLRSPLTGVLAAGGAISVALGSTIDAIMIAATIGANALVGAWQERQAGQAVAALQRIGSSSSAVLRDGRVVHVPTEEIVSGDVLVLAPGTRIAADARLISATNLEIDEAALTGESFPVSKTAEGGTAADRVVLAGTDVTVGTGHAVVFAVGSRTRIGATAAALAIDETRASPLGVRLNLMLRQVLPLAAVGGLIVVASGLLRGASPLSQLAIGAAIAIAAVPEGLPLLAGVGEAAVARRLAAHGALVRRLSSVEALGRVDVACADKTGTLTEGRLSVRLVATLAEDVPVTGEIADDARRVLVAAAYATPHPSAVDAISHPTDVAIREGAMTAGLDAILMAERSEESSFEATRPFHAAIVGDTLFLKGAVEELEPRCDRILAAGQVQTLDVEGRAHLLARATALAEQGLRVLLVAEGSVGPAIDDPASLTALGFIGIADPLRRDVPEAVRRCREAGIRIIMLTGDHPATARTIAREAGLLDGKGIVLTGAQVAELSNEELDRRLEDTVVVARVAPLDKLRIVESLQRGGHTVAMTGDGVNDGPALRLADVGVAMGIGGTEVARQAAGIVLADDNFSTLVEALVEGRSFWRNIRRALGLLLGGNLGELGLMVGASVMGLAPPLITRQILAVNMVTDVLPSLAVALQPPETRTLSALAREGTAALGGPLRNDVLRRGLVTAGPSLAAYLFSLGTSGLAEARSVAFASIISTQLAQTLDAGRAEGSLTRSVLAAVTGSAGLLLAGLTLPPLQSFLGLVVPSPLGWLLIGGSAMAAVAFSRFAGYRLLSPVPIGRLLPGPRAAVTSS